MAATAQAGKAAQEFDSPAGHNRQYCREIINKRIMATREFVSSAVYVVFDGTSYYGLFGCDIREAQAEDPDIEIISGPYRQWPDEEIEQLNDEL